MPIDVYQVDAFTDRPFRGNPAAVCPLDGPADEAWMQAVAMEMNLSETAFCWPEDDALRLRWFTPAAEVDLCGHATLATSHVLWESGRLDAAEPARFVSRSGPLGARRQGDRIELDFPARRLAPLSSDGLELALGVEATMMASDGENAFVVVADAQTVRWATPDFRRMTALGITSAIVTAHADGGEHDFVSRFFAPGIGIDEDPVTGSAHCSLGPYWAEQLGRTDLVGYQDSARGGRVHVRVDGERVHIGGSAVTVLRGELLV
jgi:PhzF family phenazine biosynthesis protein